MNHTGAFQSIYLQMLSDRMLSQERPTLNAADKESSRLISLAVDVSSALTRGLGLQEMLQDCAEAMVEHLDAAFARVWTLNEEAATLELLASAGMYSHLD